MARPSSGGDVAPGASPSFGRPPHPSVVVGAHTHEPAPSATYTRADGAERRTVTVAEEEDVSGRPPFARPVAGRGGGRRGPAARRDGGARRPQDTLGAVGLRAKGAGGRSTRTCGGQRKRGPQRLLEPEGGWEAVACEASQGRQRNDVKRPRGVASSRGTGDGSTTPFLAREGGTGRSTSVPATGPGRAPPAPPPPGASSRGLGAEGFKRREEKAPPPSRGAPPTSDPGIESQITVGSNPSNNLRINHPRTLAGL